MTLAANRVVIGSGKQTAKGTPVSPTTFPRWEDGTDIQPTLKTELIREGDGTPTIGTVIKNLQYWQGKIQHGKGRAIDTGFYLGATFGTNSDRSASNGITGTASTKSGTIGAISAGATTATYTVSAGGAPLVNDIFQIDTNTGSTTAEVVKLTSVTGTGPYTIGWAAADNPLYAHGAATPTISVVAPFTHTFVPQATRNYFTVYQQYLLATPEAVQVQDSFFHTLQFEGQAGRIIKAVYEYTGLIANDYTTTITPTLDSSSSQFLYYGGTFKVDGSTTGVAPWIKSVTYDYKYPVDDTQQTEAVTLADITSTLRQVDVKFELLFQDFTHFKKTYFNAGTTDAFQVGSGSIDIKWLAGGSDANNSLELIVSNLKYTAANLASPKLDGKALVQTVTGTATGSSTSPEMTAVLLNSQYSSHS